LVAGGAVRQAERSDYGPIGRKRISFILRWRDRARDRLAVRQARRGCGIYHDRGQLIKRDADGMHIVGDLPGLAGCDQFVQTNSVLDPEPAAAQAAQLR
jgi:hypothetical protein